MVPHFHVPQFHVSHFQRPRVCPGDMSRSFMSRIFSVPVCVCAFVQLVSFELNDFHLDMVNVPCSFFYPRPFCIQFEGQGRR